MSNPDPSFFHDYSAFFLFSITYVNVDYKDGMHGLWLGNATILLQRKKTFYYNLTIKVSINSQLDKKTFLYTESPFGEYDFIGIRKLHVPHNYVSPRNVHVVKQHFCLLGMRYV